MNDAELSHVGILGMKWGKTRTPQQRVERLNRKISKTENKSVKLEKRVIKTDVKAAVYNKQVAAQRVKFDKYLIKNMSFEMSSFGKRRAKRCAKKLRRLSKTNARLEFKSARYSKKIYKNKKLVAKLNTKISDIKDKDIALGKAMIESTFTGK